MLELISQFIIVLSIAGILIIIGRKIPETAALPVEEEKYNASKKKRKIYQKVIESVKKINKRAKFIESAKLTKSIVVGLEKILRRIRIQFLKLDQKLFFWIQKLREKSDETLKSSQKAIQFINRTKKSITTKREPRSVIDQKAAGKKLKIITEEEKYIKTIAKNPKDIESYRHLGLIYLEQKNYTDAKASFEQILKIDPKNKEAKEKLKELEKLMPS